MKNVSRKIFYRKGDQPTIVCGNCGWKYKPRKTISFVCPHCHSEFKVPAKVNLIFVTCTRCDASWIPKRKPDKIKECPFCLSIYWNKPRKNDWPEDRMAKSRFNPTQGIAELMEKRKNI